MQPEDRIINFSIPKRRVKLQALLVDFLVVIIINIVAFKFGSVQTDENTYTITGFPALVLFSANLGYFILPEIISGKTLGKSLAGLKVISLNGDDASPGQILKRHLCDVVDWMPGFFIVYFIVTSNNEKRQRVGDMFAKTVVIIENNVPQTIAST